jgi:membrane protein YqaA with SNARE-associated domain
MAKTKLRFVLEYSIRAVLWLVAFVAIYLVFKKFVSLDFIDRLKPFFDNELLILLIYTTSEVVIGIIPMEAFIIWALRNDNITEYLLLLALLSILSYLAGLAGYLIGHYLNSTLYFKSIKKRFLKNMDKWVNTFGIYLIIIAAMTPLPYSGTCMVMGSSGYPFKKFAFYAASRFVRFIIYAYVFWQVDPNI